MIIYEVIPGLLVSNFPRPLDSVLIRDRDVRAIVTLTRAAPSPEVIAIARSWLHLPLPDSRSVPVSGCDIAVTWIEGQRAAGRTVLVHCREGRNRAALVAGLVARRALGCTGEEAWRRIKDLRPLALYNAAYADHLRGLGVP